MQLVSIIVPVYKVENYLEKCVNSILNQSYKNIEVILVDDGSPDESGKLCEKMKKTDSRIIVLHKANGGLSDARNFGLQYAKGSLIMFVDSDDYIHPDMVETMYRKMEYDESDLVVCDFCKVNQEGKLLENENGSNFESRVINNDEMLDMLCSESGWRLVPAWNKLYKKEIWKDLSFPKGKLHEDEYIIHEVIEKSEKISLINNKMYYYVQRNGSIMNNITDKNRLDGAEALIKRTEFLTKINKKKQAAFCFEGAVNKMLIDVKTEDKKREKDIISNMKLIYSNYSYLLNRRNDLFKFIILQHGKKGYHLACKARKIRRKLLKKKRDNIIKRKIERLKLYIVFKINRKIGKKIAVLMVTPIHGNLGDQAIAYAEHNFIKQCGIKSVIEINRYTYENCAETIQQLINVDDLIIVNGGGNMGSLWPEEDDTTREIVASYKENQIIIFPQTCYYDQTLESKERLKCNYSVYRECANLTVSLRESKSYSFFKENFPGINCVLVPDIVLSCEFKIKQQKRKDILLCFRNDIEKQISLDSLENVTRLLQERNLKYKFTDTVVNKYIYQFNRKRMLEAKLNEFATAKLVITDRMHGMIFAAITKTPCIAVNNINGKVGNVYSKWLYKESSVICVSENEIDLELIERMEKKNDSKGIDLSNEFKALSCIVTNGDTHELRRFRNG